MLLSLPRVTLTSPRLYGTPTWEASNFTGPEETSNDKPKRPNFETPVPEKRNDAEMPACKQFVWVENSPVSSRPTRSISKLQELVLTAKY